MGEIRDPIHVFVRFQPHEERIIDSRAFQRLRNIHQLALTYLVYPGADAQEIRALPRCDGGRESDLRRSHESAEYLP